VYFDVALLVHVSDIHFILTATVISAYYFILRRSWLLIVALGLTELVRDIHFILSHEFCFLVEGHFHFS
jgi:hypothetical protein